MAHRRGNFRGRTGGISDSQRRKKSWTGITTGTVPDDLSTPNTVALELPGVSDAELTLGFFDVDGTAFQEGTILRVRGSLELPKNILGAAIVNGEIDTQYAFGLAVINSTAAAAGSIPNPASAVGASWDGWMFYRTQNQGALDANAGVVDIKSMRKLEGGQSIVFVFGAAGRIGAPGPAMAYFSGRMLVLLP